MGESLKKRDEIRLEDTWDLGAMMPSDQVWEELFKGTKDRLETYRSFQGKIKEDGQALCDCLAFDDGISQDIETLYVYAKQSLDQDTGNQKYQEYTDRADALSCQAAGLSAFIVPEILEIPDGTMKEFIRQAPELLRYERLLEQICKRREHTLGPAIEEILARSTEATQNPAQIFGMFNNADIQFDPAVDGNGNQVTVTHGRYIALMQSRDRVLRESAFHSMYKSYRQYKNTVASCFAANLKQAVFYAETRKYPSSRGMYLHGNEIPEEVYDNLIETVHRFLPLMHRYCRLRKAALGLSELHMYDAYVPLTEMPEEAISFERAKEMVLEGLAPLGGEYLALLKEGFDSRWIDIYENEGKRSGAYSWGTYGSHPYVLLNYNGTLDHVFTLAHEMGHSLHSWYSNHSQPYTYAGYRIFVAEVASTCNEALLIRHLLEQAESREEKLYLLNHFMESFRGTLFRQTMFAEFEDIVHRKAQAREALTAEALCGIYRKLNEEYFGPDMVIDEDIDYEWERIPHFYTPFYVYQYATGFSAAIAISSRILKEGKTALDGYFEFLKGGCSRTPIELLKLAGVDMEKPQPVEEALRFFGEILDEFEHLLKSR